MRAKRKTISYFHAILVPGKDLPGQDVTDHTNHTLSHCAENTKHYHHYTAEIHQILPHKVNMIKLHWARRKRFLWNITYPLWNLFTIYYVPEQRMEGTQVAREITRSHVLVRMVKHNYSQGNLMHCRLQDTSSMGPWVKTIQVCSLEALERHWVQVASVIIWGAVAAVTAPGTSQVLSHDATSFQKMLLVQGVFWQIR